MSMTDFPSVCFPFFLGFFFFLNSVSFFAFTGVLSTGGHLSPWYYWHIYHLSWLPVGAVRLFPHPLLIPTIFTTHLSKCYQQCPSTGYKLGLRGAQLLSSTNGQQWPSDDQVDLRPLLLQIAPLLLNIYHLCCWKYCLCYWVIGCAHIRFNAHELYCNISLWNVFGAQDT